MNIEKHIKRIEKYLKKIPKEEQIIVIKYIEHKLGYLTNKQLDHYVKSISILESIS